MAALIPTTLVLLLAGSPAAAQGQAPVPGTPPEEEEVVVLPKVTVIGATPLPALGIPVEKYPGNVQSVTAGQIADQNLVDIADDLYRRLGSVNIANSQNNPWQT